MVHYSILLLYSYKFPLYYILIFYIYLSIILI
nr:MAG TPA: hypothetical protein [Caudoviricetes sp.]